MAYMVSVWFDSDSGEDEVEDGWMGDRSCGEVIHEHEANN